VTTQHDERAAAALRTLEDMGYRWDGGSHWAPPLAPVPKRFHGIAATILATELAQALRADGADMRVFDAHGQKFGVATSAWLRGMAGEALASACPRKPPVPIPPGECSAPDCDCEPGWCRQRAPAMFYRKELRLEPRALYAGEPTEADAEYRSWFGW
jgi:hypothetical protein